MLILSFVHIYVQQSCFYKENFAKLALIRINLMCDKIFCLQLEKMMQDEDLGGPVRKNVFSQGIIRISQVNISFESIDK